MEPSHEYETLLSFSSKLLGIRDFIGARDHALEAQKFNPNRPEPQQVIAIADVLLAAADDWASVLQLKTPAAVADRACIRSQFTKLAALVQPSRNGFPFSEEAFNRVFSAMKSVEKLKEGGDDKSSPSSSSSTFWTVCPYCYCAHEYLIEYEDCCLRCQNCRRGFHGVAAALPTPAAVEGSSSKQEYYCGYGFFPLKYEKPSDEKEEKKEGIPVDVMEISDDSEEEKKEKEKEMEMEMEKKKKTGKYMKSIPKCSRKVTGTGKRNTIVEEEGKCATGKSNAEEETEDGDFDLEYLLKEDDVYVSLKDVV